MNASPSNISHQLQETTEDQTLGFDPFAEWLCTEEDVRRQEKKYFTEPRMHG